MSKPLVSVILPVYNGERFIEEAIESILNQTFHDWELIIVNDGSTDNTEEAIRNYLDDGRMRYFMHDRNLGIAATYNMAFSKIKGEYIAIQEQDDISMSTRLDEEIRVLSRYPEVRCVFSSALFMDIHGNIFSQWGGADLKEGLYRPRDIFYKLYIDGDFIPNPSVMMRDLKIFYDSRLKICNDFENYLKICHNHFVYFVNKPLVKMRRGEEHRTVSGNKESRFIEEQIVLKNIYRHFSKTTTLPVTFRHYSKAMSKQLFKEARYYIEKGCENKGKQLLIRAFILYPSDKKIRSLMYREYLPRPLLNSLLYVKNYIRSKKLWAIKQK